MLSEAISLVSKNVKMKIFFSFNIYIYIEIFTEYITDTQLYIHQYFLALWAEGLKVTTPQEPGAHSAPRAWFLIPFSNKNVVLHGELADSKPEAEKIQYYPIIDQKIT